MIHGNKFFASKCKKPKMRIGSFGYSIISDNKYSEIFMVNISVLSISWWHGSCGEKSFKKIRLINQLVTTCGVNIFFHLLFFYFVIEVRWFSLEWFGIWLVEAKNQ
ncbi:hypothetical protein AK965_01980 [Vibrio sp. PID17_43]|nr:hypothetical protein AK965_01980 [Vibrio sp. PID17_43]